MLYLSSTWGRLGFDRVYLDMTASGRNTLNSNLKLNDETSYSFAPAFVAA